MIIGNKDFKIGSRTYIMGILNITPDSFSDGGKFNNIENALSEVEIMIKNGVDIIDIGGESTRPNHIVVEQDEEIKRVVPIIKAIRENYDIPISIDTYKGEVAKQAIEAGANLINDIWGFKKCKYISKVAAMYDVPCCLMHNRKNLDYGDDLVNDVILDMKESIDIALNAGVKQENIMLDPGIGFVKTLEQNIELMDRLDELKVLNLPILLGTSRKSMIGLTLNLKVDERLEGTLATTVIGITKGVDFVRVHDVKENKRAASMTDAIIRR